MTAASRNEDDWPLRQELDDHELDELPTLQTDAEESSQRQLLAALNPPSLHESPLPATSIGDNGERPESSRERAVSKQHVPVNRDGHGKHLKPFHYMLVSYFGGVSLAICHHIFYWSYAGSEVASVTEQERNLFIGNTLATLVKLFLSAPVAFAYVQWLWKRLKRPGLKLKGLDAAFGVLTSPIELFKPELLFKLDPVGLFLILIVWGVSIPSVFTPVTLTIMSTDSVTPVRASVSQLDIANVSQAHRYAYFTPMNSSCPDADPGSYAFEGPRTIPTRLSVATAAFGEDLTISPPANRSSYRLSFLAPRVRCAAGNATMMDIVGAMLAERNAVLLNSSSNETLGYYAFVPSYPLLGLADVDASNNLSIGINGNRMIALDQPRLQVSPRNATNQVWMMYYRYETYANGSYVLEDGSRIPIRQHSVCSLWNTTHTVDFSFDGGVQEVRIISMEDHGLVAYPPYDPSTPSDLSQHAYTAVFSVLTDLLVGDMGFVTSTAPGSTANSSFGVINSPIARTSLLGSNDLDYVFALNRYTQGTPLDQISVPYDLSDQRLLDKALAKNRTLPYLIEQLAFNITMSMMNDPLLAPLTLADTTQLSQINVYRYHVEYLWIAYGTAIVIVGLTLVLARFTIHENRASHTNSVSALMSISRDEELAPLFPACCRGKQPLPEETKNAELMIEGTPETGQSLKPQGAVEPVCRTCNPSQPETRSSKPRRPSLAFRQRKRAALDPPLPR